MNFLTIENQIVHSSFIIHHSSFIITYKETLRRNFAQSKCPKHDTNKFFTRTNTRTNAKHAKQATFSADLMCILCRFGRFNHTRNSKPETKNSKPTPFHPQFQHLYSPTLCLHAHEIQASWQAVQIEAEQTGRDLRHLVLFHQNAPHVRQAHGAGLTFAGRQVEPSLLVRGVGKE